MKGTGINENNSQRGHYYQSIARYFFHLRGAPFFLSSCEMEIIAKWEERNIPLNIVMEGIKSGYERFMAQHKKKFKEMSLLFCEREVLSTFEQYKEKKVGLKKKDLRKTNKRERIMEAIGHFLMRLPPETAFLREVFVHMLEDLTHGKWDETNLEKAEEEIEALILKNISTVEFEKVSEKIRSEYSVQKKSEMESLIRIKAIKMWREKYKVPYLSPFYY